jgi:hypothetical protein
VDDEVLRREDGHRALTPYLALFDEPDPGPPPGDLATTEASSTGVS